MQTTITIAPLRSVIRVVLATALLLLVPLLAMQFTSEVNWGPKDFAVGGTLLFAAGMSWTLLSAKSASIAYRLAAALAVATALLLVWGNLAVGLIGSEHNPANLMYAGVIGVAIIGALAARVRAHGMSRALFATSLAQALIAAIVLAAGLGAGEPPGRLGILILNGGFVALFALSGWLFARAASGQAD
ncbi:MAG TPA: hypothetical protein VJL61_12845 [Rhodanobacteraceae bacterium]|nr:hypothetical protein [Rhodanobacteraceae bacterium]